MSAGDDEHRIVFILTGLILEIIVRLFITADLSLTLSHKLFSGSADL